MLPNLVFFQHTPSGLKWLVEHLQSKKAPLFEVGAGVGKLSLALEKRGVGIIPMDLMERENPATRVVVMDALDFPFPEGSWLLVARPCHGRFFTELVDHARERKCAGVTYVGKEENLEDDTAPHRFCKVAFKPLGKDGELAWDIEFKRPKRKPGKLKCCVVADPGGACGQGPVEEAAELQESFEEALGQELDVQLVMSPHEIPIGTKLVLYDFGGMMGCDGLMQDNSRTVIKWAQDHPNSFVVVVSDFTYRNFIEYELESLGLIKRRRSFGDDPQEEGLFNLIQRDWNQDRLGIPEWAFPKP